jgi:MFS transporter, PPP family, 3-phenylpropionic acid transporter
VIAVSLVYLGYFAALGAFWPYYGPLLGTYGLSLAEVTQVVAIGPACGLLLPPLVGLLADALRARALILRLLSAAAGLAFLGFFVATTTWQVVVTVVVFSVCRAPLVTLLDASAMAIARSEGSSYGRMRLWGSLGFLGAALLAAELAGRGGPRAVLPLSLALLGVAALAAWFIPSAAVAFGRGPVVAAWLERLRHRPMWLFVGAAALGTAAHALYDVGFSLHLTELGLGGRFIGLAWGLGVGVEVGVLALSGRVVGWLGAERLFALAFVVAAGRWLLLAHAVAPWLILVAQPLHAVTFGLCYVAGVTVAHDHGSPRAPTAAQGLFTAAAALGAVVGMVVAGRLLAAWGGRGMFLVAAALSALASVSATAFIVTTSRAARG